MEEDICSAEEGLGALRATMGGHRLWELRRSLGVLPPIVDALQTVAAFGLRIFPAADQRRTIGTTIDFDSCRQAGFNALTGGVAIRIGSWPCRHSQSDLFEAPERTGQIVDQLFMVLSTREPVGSHDEAPWVS